MSPNEYHKILGARKLSLVGFAHRLDCRCTTALLEMVSWGVLWKNENLWFLRCESWNGLQMSPNEYTMKVLVHESFEFGGFCTWPTWSVHHGICSWLGGLFCEKNEIRGFWDVKVGMAYKFLQRNTIKFLVHESFKFGEFCTCPSWSIHDGIGR